MTLPLAVQQTVEDVQRHFEIMQSQITKLKHENLELSKQLNAGGRAIVPPPTEPIPMIEFPGEVACHWSEPRLTSAQTLGTVESQDGSVLAEYVTKSNDVSARKSIGPLSASKLHQLKTDPFENEEEAVRMHGSFMSSASTNTNLLFLDDDTLPLMKRITEAMLFKVLTTLAIAANTVYMGVAADQRVRNAYARIKDIPVEPESALPGYIFTAWFSLELFIKILADGKDFILGEDQYWNVFDSLLVLESIMDITLSGAGLKLSFLRIFRVFRLVRVVRMVKSVQALAKLRTMIFAILNTFIDLCWAFLVIFLILFMFGIVMTTLVSNYLDAVDMRSSEQMVDAELCGTMFGSLGDSMLSLWSAVSGGNDWMTYGEPLRKISDWAFSLFLFYISFCTVGLFNVVTGVFVDGAVTCRTGDEEVQSYLDDLRNTTEEIKDFFKDADVDGSGTLNLKEFQHLMKKPRAKAYFSGLNIDPEEAGILFSILDQDQSQGILIDEFVHGTMKLKGAASKLDLVTVMYDLTRQGRRFDGLCDLLERELASIKGRLPDKASYADRAARHTELLPRALAETVQDGGLSAVRVAQKLADAAAKLQKLKSTLRSDTEKSMP